MQATADLPFNIELDPGKDKKADPSDYIDPMDPAYKYKKAVAVCKNDDVITSALSACEDEDVERMIRYITFRKSDASVEEKKAWIQDMMLDIHGALKVHYGKRSRTKSHIVCSILGDGSADQVNGMLPQLSSGEVEAYETFFFDVRPHLDKPIYIMERALSKAIPHMERVSCLPKNLMAAVAYFCGWSVYHRMLNTRVGMPDEAETLIYEIGRQREIFKSVCASLVESVDSENATDVLYRYSGDDGVGPGRGDMDKTGNEIAKTLKEVREKVNLDVARGGDLEQKDEPVETLNIAREPEDTEAKMVSA